FPVFLSTQRHPAFRNNLLEKLQQTILKLVRCPRFDSCAPAHFDLSVCPSMLLASPRLHSRSYPRHFYVDHSHCLVLAPATLAALPSTRALPDRDVFYVPCPTHSILPSYFA